MGGYKESDDLKFLSFGECCRELVDAADEMTRRLYNVID